MASCGTLFQGILDLFFGSDNKQLPSLHKLNDSVYEFYSPRDGSFSSEIIFFHGFERGDLSKAHVETWTSFLDSTFICWPQTLLSEEFRRARILSVSYDSCITKGPKQGNLDLYLTAENLVQDLIDDAKVAANPGLPVILVGKDIGGLVIKAICMEAKAQNRFTFLSNVKGIFYYRTPHLGIDNLPRAFTGALVERLAFFDNYTARLNSEFSNYRRNKWATRAIISLQRSEKVPELVISEASQRHDVDEYYTPNQCIDTVCKSQARTSSSFRFLTSLISRIERKELLFASPPVQDQTEDVGFKTSLGFGDDGSYVPMETTADEVKNALQKKRIVVLHGGPGSGKSSLARYLALQFEAAAKQQATGVVATSSAEQSSWLPNGVVYMACGKGAEIISMQRELLRKFNIALPILEDNLIPSGGAAELQKRLRQALVDQLSEFQFCVVVVLDDVWDGHLVENLLVPGDRVRYLLTTQISTLWNNAHDSKRVQMQDATLEDARRILGNYANFEGGVISKELENLADEIIAATGFHPLALATLGVVLNNMDRTVEDWHELKDNLKEHLKVKDYQPSSFGTKYPLSVHASMMLVVDLLDTDAKTLLYKITLFDGPFIPEILLRLFLKYTLPRNEKMSISQPKSSLVAKGLVRIESETFGENVTHPIYSNGGNHPRVIWIHGLRQHFILTTETEEIRHITYFLDNDSDHNLLRMRERSDLDLATALCALYGAANIKKRALQRMGSDLTWSEEYSGGLASALRPFVFLMLSEGDTKNPISQAAAEVFLKYVRNRQLDGDKISELLKLTDYPSAPLFTLAALFDIFAIEEVKLINEDHLSFLKVILSHLDSHDDVYREIQEKAPSKAPLIQEYATRALFSICRKARREKSTALVLNVPNVVTVLVGLIQGALAKPTEDSNLLARNAAQTLVNLTSQKSIGGELSICDTDGALACLVQSLSGHDNLPLQEYAAATLGNLANGDADTKLKICNTNGALAGIVQSLSVHDNLPLQERAALTLGNLAVGDVEIKLKICNVEGALAGLIKSLSARDNHPLQQNAARALENLAYRDADVILKICSVEGALTGLGQSLSAQDNHLLEENAAGALRNLAAGDVATKLKICNTEGVLTGLINSLSANHNHRLQEFAAMALVNLTTDGADTKFKICTEEGALSNLFRSLLNDKNPPLQGQAARLLQSLATDAASGRKICDEPGILAAFVKCLSERKNPGLQSSVALALANIACVGDVDITLKICNEEDAVSGLVELLFEQNNAVQTAAAWAFSSLAGHQHESVQLKLANEKGALESLVRALTERNNPLLQSQAASTLQSLARGLDSARKICAEPGSIAALVSCLSESKSSALQLAAAATLANIACVGDVDIALKLCNEEGAVSGLVELLFEQNNAVQIAAALAFSSLAGHQHESVQLKLANEKGALESLVRALTERNKPLLQSQAASTLQSLARGLDSARKICAEPGSIAALVSCLSESKNPALQLAAAATLANLAWAAVDIALKICHEEGALSGLVKLLLNDDNEDVQQVAAWSFKNLALKDETAQLKVANEKGAIDGLLRAMSKDNMPIMQEKAVIALSSLAMVAGKSIKLKFSEENGAVGRLVELSEHKNTELRDAATGLLVTLGLREEPISLNIVNGNGQERAS